jgi:hypothetical protein
VFCYLHLPRRRGRDKRLKLLNVLKFTIRQDLESNIFDCRLSRGDRGQLDWGRRKIRLIEGNAKCRHLKKFTCKMDFVAGVEEGGRED